MVERKVTKTRYTSGRATIANFIRAAERVLAEQGHAALSLRRVAQECGLPTGNVSYYFPAKQQLIKAMLDSIVADLAAPMDELERWAADHPNDGLVKYLSGWMKFNEESRVARIYVEIWSMANNDPEVRAHLDQYYAHGEARVRRMLARLNPELSAEAMDTLSIFAISIMEGLMLFGNNGHRHARHMPILAAYAMDAVLHHARSPDSASLRSLVDQYQQATAVPTV